MKRLHSISLRTIILLAVATWSPISAQESPDLPVIVIPIGIPSSSSITLELGYAPFILTIVPIEPAPATIVSPGTRITLLPSTDFGDISDINWFFNGTQIANNTAELVIESARAADSGYYYASFSGYEGTSTTQNLLISVQTADRHRLVNQSSRVTISPSSPTAIFGFVIDPPVAGSVRGQEVLIRAVGPGLSDHGVPNPLPDPEMVVRSTKTGNDIGIGFTQIVFPDGTTPETRYLDRIRRVSAEVGAFPITLPESLDAVGANQVLLIPLQAGGYTVTVSSHSGASGDVLVEVYEVTEPNHRPIPVFEVPVDTIPVDPPD